MIGSFSGIRPATEHRDYQIRSIPELNLITVGGIRSTGLTAASGIAEFVAALFTNSISFDSATDNPRDVLPELGNDPVLPPYLPSAELEPGALITNPPAPSLAELASNYFERGDGQVLCFGRLWKVTHPLSQIGLRSSAQKDQHIVPPTTSQGRRQYYDWRFKGDKGSPVKNESKLS